MAKQIGSLVLPDSMEWTNRYQWSPVAQSLARTLSGNQVIYSQPLNKGRPIILSAASGVTWLGLADVLALDAMAAIPDATYSLIWEAETFTVMFDQDQRGAIQFSPIWPHHDSHTGEIRLITV